MPPPPFISNTDSLAERIQSGNDPEAKSGVADLLWSFGWRDILDLGDRHDGSRSGDGPAAVAAADENEFSADPANQRRL